MCEVLLVRCLTHWQVSDMNALSLCHQAVSSFGEAMQSHKVILFPELAHGASVGACAGMCGKCRGQAMTGVLRLSTAPLEPQPQ